MNILNLFFCSIFIVGCFCMIALSCFGKRRGR
jgi:hypothetical protein